MVIRTMRDLTIGLLILAASAGAQDFISLEQAASRTGHDLTAAYEGKSVAIRGQVALAPVWAVGIYYLPVRDNTDHGLILRGERNMFSDLDSGDWIEARGTIQARGGLPLLVPSNIARIRHEPAPDPKDLPVADLCSPRYLGLMVRTTATVTAIGENLGGKSLEITDRGNTMAVFLPRPLNATGAQLARVRTGDHVRLTGLATQYSLEPPHDRDFQIMLASPAGVEIVQSSWMSRRICC